MRRLVISLALLIAPALAPAADGNRLAYLDECSTHHPGLHFPKLTTPQWVGEDGVDCVVILSIDDMKDSKKYEDYLRPILNRLKKIDGRAPVSIMACNVQSDDPQLQAWLKEGLSLETHTFDHPCPLLGKTGFDKAKETYDKCVDLLATVPNSKPVAFRTPCCDSLNTFSPRFVAEIFNKRTAKLNFLTIDSSVFNVFTSADNSLPRDLVLDSDGTERFRKYTPADRAFGNTIDNYPYPYVIDRTCWEIPCVMPSDWAAQHRHKPNNPITIRDWQAALDATVLKQGVFCLVFHPHNWIKPEQVVELIDHAVTKHGKKVKFLTFQEVQERLNKNLLGGQPLRHPESGKDNGVRLLDLDNDGYMDVVIGNADAKKTRVWSPEKKAWSGSEFPNEVVKYARESGLRFGVLQKNGQAAFLHGSWQFAGNRWEKMEEHQQGLKPYVVQGPRLVSQRLLDLDGDGVCEILFTGRARNVYSWSAADKSWNVLPFSIPGQFALALEKDSGARFVDLNGDGKLDLLISNEEGFGVYLFQDMKTGWRAVREGKPGDANALPLIARKGENMGAWFQGKQLWVQNEHTAVLKDLVERRTFAQLVEAAESGAKSPDASLRSIQTRPGFTVELMAAEPLVQDPIAIAFGPDGKVWVVEMGDYPLGTDGKGKPGGRVLCLEDTKGTGKLDKSTVFLDGLPFPTSVLPWKKGVLVTCAPDIFYAEDTDGDGKADKKEVLYTGFKEGNQQHRVNSLVWGLDGWIYCANGDSGGVIKSVKTGQTVNISGRDFRIRPDTGAIDLQAGQTQYGRCRDDWGNWFGNNNSNPLWHYALEDHYLRRNPHVAAPDGRVNVSVTPGAAPVFPISKTATRFNSPQSANHFTSACSPIVYRDDLFGPAFAHNTFVCEPVHNLVHREVMTAKGTTFTSRRADDEQKSEFLASSDGWFRPTTVAVGPDGALWVVDMYRHVIEHPEWIPKDWQMKLDLRAGHDQGRIYRVYPKDAKPRAAARLDKLDVAGLVAALDSPSGWQRDTAQMLLLDKTPDMVSRTEAAKLLIDLLKNSKRPEARLHALCTLDALVIAPTHIQDALADTHPAVRRHAVRVAERHLKTAPDLAASLLKLVGDPDPLVRLQLAYTLGEWDDARAGEALARLALANSDDRFITAAVVSSLNNKKLLDAFYIGVFVPYIEGKGTPPAALLDSFILMTLAQNDTKALAGLIAWLAKPQGDGIGAGQVAAFAGLLDALDQRNTTLQKLHDGGDAELKKATAATGSLFAAARALLADKKATPENQQVALRLLGRGLDKQGADVELMAGLLKPQTERETQAAVVAALGKLRDPAVPGLLIRGWKSYGPALRTTVLDTLFRRDDWLKATLEALEKKEIPPGELDALRRQRLVEHKDADVRRRAAALFAGAIAPDRQKVIDAFQPALKLTGDPKRGVAVFTKHCAGCHKLGDVGHVVGPDLASVGDKSPQGLLIAVLDPNRVVEARYVNFTALTKNGQTFTGVLTAETGTSVTLLMQEGKTQTILRSDLDELLSTGKSPMPEGLEKDLPHQDLADLIAFVGGQAPPPQRKVFAGNRPEVVKPDKAGTLLLAATNGEIYGTTLVLEKEHNNLGYWTNDDDHVVWSVDVPKAGTYAVWLDWACADTSAGKPFILSGGASDVTGKVAATGGWDKYQQAKVGDIVLAAGAQRLTLKAGRKLNGSALIDLKGVKLVPVRDEK